MSPLRLPIPPPGQALHRRKLRLDCIGEKCAALEVTPPHHLDAPAELLLKRRVASSLHRSHERRQLMLLLAENIETLAM